jgi:hypothetical protein
MGWGETVISVVLDRRFTWGYRYIQSFLRCPAELRRQYAKYCHICHSYSCHRVRDTDLDTKKYVESPSVEFSVILVQRLSGGHEFLFNYSFRQFGPVGSFV